MIAPLVVAALVLVAECLRAARDAQSSADPRGKDRLSQWADRYSTWPPTRWRNRAGDWFVYTDSWRNKYKGGKPAKGPAFPGSTTWLVGLTDFWHCSQAAYGLCYAAALVIAGTHPAAGWQWALVTLAGRLVFESAFRWFRKV